MKLKYNKLIKESKQFNLIKIMYSFSIKRDGKKCRNYVFLLLKNNQINKVILFIYLKYKKK